MSSQERGISNFRGSLLNSASFALLTAGILSFSAAQVLKTAQTTNDLRFNLSAVSWWSSLNLHVEKKEIPPLLPAPELRIASVRSLAHPNHRVKVRRPEARSQLTRQLQGGGRRERLQSILSQFVETERAIEVASAAAIPAPLEVMVPVQDEATRLRLIHQSMAIQFRLAMSGQALGSSRSALVLNTQGAPNGSSGPELSSAVQALAISPRRDRTPVAQTKAATSDHVEPLLLSGVRVVPSSSVLNPGLPSDVVDSRVGVAIPPFVTLPVLAPVSIQPRVSTEALSIQLQEPQETVFAPKTASKAAEIPAPSVPSSPALTDHEPTVTPAERYSIALSSAESRSRTAVPVSPLLALGKLSTPPTVVSTQSDLLANQVGTSQVGRRSAVKRLVAPVTEQAAHRVETHPTSSHLDSELTPEKGITTAPVRPSLEVVQKSMAGPVREPVAAVEAFNWKLPVDAKAEVFSWEGSARESTHQWNVTRATGYWPTLSYQARGPGQVPAALLSANSALLLAASSGARLQSEAGIVFGFIPAQQTVQFSGRSEKALYLDGPQGYRAFAFVNAAPGAHILYTNEGAALAIPVLDGKATFLDLTQLRRHSFSGRVFDAGSRSAKPQKSVTVKVVGYPGASALTDGQGYFSLENVPTFGDYPIYLETTLGSEFKHRYRVSTNRRGLLGLFRFSAEKIDSWLRQLEGGVSPDSGIVIAAFPQLAASQDRGSLIAKVRPALKGSSLPPETYTLSPTEHLSEISPLDAQSARSISVQVPEGLNMAQVLHRTSGKVLWSELVIASPGVVNVLGPY